MAALETAYQLTPACFTEWVSESDHDRARVLELMESVAEHIYAHLEATRPGVEFYYHLAEIPGMRDEMLTAFSVVSPSGEAYLVEDARGGGWLVCRCFLDSRVTLRRIKCSDDPMSISAACLGVLGGNTSSTQMYRRFH